jgi:putative phosphoribosyl transferase
MDDSGDRILMLSQIKSWSAGGSKLSITSGNRGAREAFMFKDRADAGRKIAAEVLRRHYQAPLVLALPRGGVPVAAEVAKAIHTPLHLLFVRKIGVPWQPEMAAAAIVDGQPIRTVFNMPAMRAFGLDVDDLRADIEREKRELERRRTAYRIAGQRPSARGRTAIVVDDGLATGTTMRAALEALRAEDPEKLVVAVPIAPANIMPGLQRLADETICLSALEDFRSVRQAYRDFRQLSDTDVLKCLRGASLASPDPLRAAS